MGREAIQRSVLGLWPEEEDAARCSTVAEASRILRSEGVMERLQGCETGAQVVDLLCEKQVVGGMAA